MIIKSFLFLCSFSIVYTLFPQQTFAFQLYPKAERGFDISFPQCSGTYPTPPYAFGIVGVTDGKAFTNNNCLFEEFIWATKASYPASVYMNLNYPAGLTATLGERGIKGICKKNNLPCQAYNYGYKAATQAYEYATSQLVNTPIWWLDVETANTWSDDISLNNKVVEGALDFFSQRHISAGIYSTRSEWKALMGNTFIPTQNLIHPVPNWIAGVEEEPVSDFCSHHLFPDSHTMLVQYADGSFDGNYVCP